MRSSAENGCLFQSEERERSTRCGNSARRCTSTGLAGVRQPGSADADAPGSAWPNWPASRRMQRTPSERPCARVSLPWICRSRDRRRCDCDAAALRRARTANRRMSATTMNRSHRDCNLAQLASRPAFAMMFRKVGPRSVSVGTALPASLLPGIAGIIQDIELLARGSSEPVGARRGLKSQHSTSQRSKQS